MYPPVQTHPDLLVVSSSGEKQLLVEVKSWLPTAIEDTPADWAQQTRNRRHFADGYLLLVTPESVALWLPPLVNAVADVPPIRQPSADVLANYLKIESYPLAALSEQELQLVVTAWLGSVMFKPAATLLALPAQAWLVESGLHAAIFRGFIRRELMFG